LRSAVPVDAHSSLLRRFYLLSGSKYQLSL